MNLAQASRKVLAVDDDPVALFITKSHLAKAGYEVHTAESVAEAKEVLLKEHSLSFAAIVSDYRMPGGTGLDLLQYVRDSDPALAVIMVTVEGEKSLVANSLRGGAVDFLDKPVGGAVLLEAVDRAIKVTDEQRTQTNAVHDVTQMAQSQRMLLGQSTASLGTRFRSFFRPHEKAGGDFVAAFPVSEEHFVVLVSDVSGHDAQAAYRSAYLQGFARALLINGSSIEDTFEQLNRLIFSEWNTNDEEILSLAACAACVNTRTQTFQILNCGLPLPYLVDEQGWAFPLSDSSATPLGWFPAVPAPLSADFGNHRLLFWSDGLEDLSDKINCDPLAIACRLNTNIEHDDVLFSTANDDIISVHIDLTPNPESSSTPAIPILSRRYAGSEHAQIDEHQSFFERSLNVAFPLLSADTLHDCIICTREALINALIHGCKSEADCYASLQIAWNPKENTLFVRISDEGNGHNFDFLSYEDIANSELIPAHHGLLMIKYLSKSLDISNSGSTLTMEFSMEFKQ